MSSKIHSSIHPTAIVDPRAELDTSVEIGPYCIIGPKVTLGKGTRLQSHVVIEGRTRMGENNEVFPFSVLGAIPQDLKYKGEDTELIIGNNNRIRESATINLGTIGAGGKTVIGNDNLIMAYVHIGHDCVIGNTCILANSVNMAGHVTIEDYVNIGGMVGISQYVRIGKHTYFAGLSGTDRDIPPYTIAIGDRPTEIKGANIVGLRRRGVKTETISIINESLKLWKRPDVVKEQCLLEIESQYGEVPEVRYFVEFIRNSKNGCIK